MRKRDMMEHFGYFSWIQRPKIYRNQLQNCRQFFGRLPVLPCKSQNNQWTILR